MNLDVVIRTALAIVNGTTLPSRRRRRRPATESKTSTPAAIRRRVVGRRFWTAGEDARMWELYPDLRSDVIAGLLQRTQPAIYARAKTLGLEKSEAFRRSIDACRLRRDSSVGIPYRFKKGIVPANKGLRRPGYGPGRMKDTQFKKGGVSINWMPVGSTRVCDGYVYRKMSDVRHVPWTQNWVLEHRRIWEETHGPVPAGHALKFKNGNKTDVRLDNLELITRRQLMARNTVHNLPPELAKTIQLLGALNRQIRRREKDHGQKQDRRPA